MSLLDAPVGFTDDGIVWVGSDDLRASLRAIPQLRETEGNPRRGDVEAIAASLRRFGQVKPVVIDSEDHVTIRAGHHMTKAAILLGWTHVAITEARFLTPSDARAFLLADNRLAELGTFDATQQLSLLEEMERNGGWEGTGFTIDDAEDLRAQLSLVAETPYDGAWEGGFTESQREAAERAASLAASMSKKERVLMLSGDQDEEYQRCIRILQPAYGTQSYLDTVLRALAEEALRHAATEPTPEP